MCARQPQRFYRFATPLHRRRRPRRLGREYDVSSRFSATARKTETSSGICSRRGTRNLGRVTTSSLVLPPRVRIHGLSKTLCFQRGTYRRNRSSKKRNRSTTICMFCSIFIILQKRANLELWSCNQTSVIVLLCRVTSMDAYSFVYTSAIISFYMMDEID